MNKIEFELKNRCGIYIFTNLDNGKRYVGSSKDLYNRLHEHLHNFKNNKAHNKYFQSSWNKYGEDMFIYGILEYCEENVRFVREQHYIDSLNPEYNLTKNVIANLGYSPNEDVRQKISDTLKSKYASGEIKTYRQDHNWIKSYIYNIHSYSICAECECRADAFRLLNLKDRDNSVLKNTIFKNTYCIADVRFETQSQAKNYICQNSKKCISNNGEYLISEDVSGNISYHKTILECASFTGSSKSTISKHADSTKENPFIVKSTNYKIYFSNDFYPYEETAVPLEESMEELLLTKNGELCDGNTVVSN